MSMRAASLLLALLVVRSLPSQSATLRLVPQPREVAERAASAVRGVSVAVPGGAAEDRFAARDLTDALAERGIVTNAVGGPGTLRVTLLRAGTPAAERVLQGAGLHFDSAMRAEGYALVVEGGHADVVGATAAGVFYGVQTLKQLVEGSGRAARVRGARIRDWPAMRYRGLHDDLSRGPVPTIEFQKRQVRTFAAYKMNVYSPYFEHTLAYGADPLIAPPGGAMTRADVKELVSYAAKYHVDVIPEQEAFGHLHHVLKWERYSPLAETEHGHVLAPGQAASLPLIKSMFAEIDSLFPSRFIHLGADETFELGRGQTAGRVQSEGIGPVYLGFLGQIEEALRPTGKRFLFWGDVAMNHPDLVKNLPKDMIAVGWDYGLQRNGWTRFLAPFKDAGMETWVAPGVNNWNRVYPNNAVALPNIQGFIRDGQRMGSTGVLNTSWDDDGEAIFNQTWYGVLFGAAASWQPGESDIDRFARSYGAAFHGDTTGAIDSAQRVLAQAHALLQAAGVGDASDYLFWLDPWSDEGRLTAGRIRASNRQLRLLAEEAIVQLARARAGAPQGLREPDALAAIELGARRMDLIGMKFQFADEVVQMYDRAYAMTLDSARRGGASRDLGDITGINGRLQDLRDAYSLTRDLYEQAWRRENRPYWINNVLARYDMSTQLWIARSDRVNQARQGWYRNRRLPPPGDIGLPTTAQMPGLGGTTTSER